MSHLDWACEKDIYKLTRRTEGQGAPAADEEKVAGGSNRNGLPSVRKKAANYPWLSPREVAQQMLRTRRNGKGITNECCTRRGCTWEEYAEYCPNNKRRHIK